MGFETISFCGTPLKLVVNEHIDDGTVMVVSICSDCHNKPSEIHLCSKCQGIGYVGYKITNVGFPDGIFHCLCKAGTDTFGPHHDEGCYFHMQF